MTKRRKTICLILALTCIDIACATRIEASDSHHMNPKSSIEKRQEQNGVNLPMESSKSHVNLNDLSRFLQKKQLFDNASSFDLQEADKLLLAGKFKEAEHSYRQQLTSDTKGKAYVGAVYSILEQPGEGNLYRAEILLKEAKSKFATEPSVIAAAGHLAYLVAQRTKSPSKRMLYLEASQILCLRSMDNRPHFLHPNLTNALVCASLEGPEAIETSKEAYRSIVHMALRISNYPFKPIPWSEKLWESLKRRESSTVNYSLSELLDLGEKSLERRDTPAAEKYYKEILEVLDCSRFYYPHLQYQEGVQSKAKLP